MTQSIKKVFFSIIPDKYLIKLKEYKKRKFLKKFDNLSNIEIFSKIYNENLWGDKNDRLKFNSGLGSRDYEVIDLYIKSLENYFITKNKINVLDFGCGDFYVGSRIRHIFQNYFAVDIVPNLIEYNKVFYENLNVNFLLVNENYDMLPDADMIIVRQVFQHMSNDDIKLVLKSIRNKFKYLLLTEHVPIGSDIVWNIDKKANSDIRLSFNSGINLELNPFNISYIEKFDLCEIERSGGLIKSVLYKLY
jgi:SAM-dependent methyltransferase